jgi:hypothetical protein
MAFKDLAHSLRVCLGCALVLTALTGSTYAAGPVAVPEIDAGLAGSAVALVVGGYLFFVAKVRRK